LHVRENSYYGSLMVARFRDLLQLIRVHFIGGARAISSLGWDGGIFCFFAHD
jgi:hypothetical protein